MTATSSSFGHLIVVKLTAHCTAWKLLMEYHEDRRFAGDEIRQEPMRCVSMYFKSIEKQTLNRKAMQNAGQPPEKAWQTSKISASVPAMIDILINRLNC
ncbi:hypothetical protein T265_05890 [Opisthorchis viverrini]|uniref:Uncharacterized protein n=1 Tax=Opisthorchis viverrini TaxID=6198 RepID=A0A075AER4_OPIVI|nr:hypothetical protein T265_05890 [Opisthorchis viverrini]KER26984.1 hypothetical protein T265_05890 [Opisthorchis viverrini]